MLLQLTDVEKRFDLPSGQGKIAVLDGISLTVTQGESIAIVGPSGSGKSTLLNIIGALESPTSGSITFQEQNLAECGERTLARIRNLEIGYIFQLHHLLPQCTVLENVLLPTIPTSVDDKIDSSRERARKLLDRVGLEQQLHQYPSRLSGGELQRVAVVRALINSPKLLLADEPTGSLDRQSSDNLIRLLIQLNREEGAALILVTHAPELSRLMDKTYVLQEGKLLISEEKSV